MFDSSVIARSGQSPKAAVALSAVFIGGAITVAGNFLLKQYAPDVQVIARMAGAVLAIGGLLMGCFMVRCPACKKRWVVDAMRRHSAGNWMFALASAHTCPNCGYPDAVTPTPPHQPLERQ